MKLFLYVLISSLYFNLCYAQIKVTEVNFIGDTIQKKPKIYDGESDFLHQPKLKDYNQYIGYDIFISDDQILMCRKPTVVTVKNTVFTTYLYNPFVDSFGKLTCNQKYIKNKTYKILDLNFANDIIFNNLSKKEDLNYYIDTEYAHVRNYFTNEEDNYNGGTVLMKLLDKETNEIVYTSFYIQTENYINKEFIFVPYFENLKKKYDNKQLTLYELGFNKDGPSYYFTDIYTGIKISRKLKSKWNCNIQIMNLSLLPNSGFETKKYRFSPDKSHNEFGICYLLKNELGQSVVIPELRTYDFTFILTEEYNNIIKKNLSIEQQEKIRTYNLKKKQLELFNEKKKNLINKFGLVYGTLICNNQVKIGMSGEMCKESWGEAIEIKQKINTDGNFELWYYGNDIYLKFKDDLLYEIQNFFSQR